MTKETDHLHSWLPVSFDYGAVFEWECRVCGHVMTNRSGLIELWQEQ